METENFTTARELANLASFDPDSDTALLNLKTTNTPLWKMAILYRIIVDPIAALSVNYLDIDLVEYGIIFITEKLSRFWDEIKDVEKSDLFTALTLLLVYDRFRISKLPLNVVMPDLLDILTDRIEEGIAKRVMNEDIWDYYLNWINRTKAYYDDVHQINLEIKHILQEQLKLASVIESK